MFGLRDGFRARGHETRVLTSTAGLESDDPVVDYRALGTTSSFRTLLQTANPWAASALRRALEDFRPDVVHLNLFLTQLSPLILRVLKSPGLEKIPCVYYAQWQRAICPIGTRILPGGAVCKVPWGRACYQNGCLPMRDWVPLMLQMRALGAWIGSVDRIVAISNFVRERLEEACFEGVDVIHGGVPERAHRPPLAGPPRIGFAGRLVPEKGVDVLLRACHLLIGDFPQLKLDIVGDGPALSGARALVEELSLGECVTFHGKQSQPEMEQVFAARLGAGDPFGLGGTLRSGRRRGRHARNGLRGERHRRAAGDRDPRQDRFARHRRAGTVGGGSENISGEPGRRGTGGRSRPAGCPGAFLYRPQRCSGSSISTKAC